MTVEVRCWGVGGGWFSRVIEDKDKALSEASARGDVDEVRRLLAAGADVNA
eukprot:CAMPEP_0175856196 /NCGR_PEP_ID=MMETSP0107_2-20121207/28359_1 /TAXON_ID=195067 ORGANISM="Goniomonas pacifica, Strain CCMP1869" /NCGR_SAMPLE_ID=MMETSP0107_2 /ASSEMBLY_ACC=CAM_ASM_000203 /LENGTH=50 /DNA_ID=CAMNT_0017172265 /DNA_START=1 /DNA_END=150 /DNA_ORIENTATION=-